MSLPRRKADHLRRQNGGIIDTSLGYRLFPEAIGPLYLGPGFARFGRFVRNRTGQRRLDRNARRYCLSLGPIAQFYDVRIAGHRAP